MSAAKNQAATVALLFLASIPVIAQSGGSNSSASSNSSPNPVGATLNDSITLSLKGTDSATRSMSYKASVGWALGCVANNTTVDGKNGSIDSHADLNKGSTTAAVDAVQHEDAIDCNGPFTPQWFNHAMANDSIEVLIAASADYEDSWKATTSPSVLSQTYYGAVDFLKGWQPKSLRAHKYEGVMAGVSEIHSSSQLIRYDTVLGASYFFQRGSLQSVASNGQGQSQPSYKSYFLVAAGPAAVAITPISAVKGATVPNQYSAAGKLDFGGRTFFFAPTPARTKACKNDVAGQPQKVCPPTLEGDLSASVTLPFTNLTTSLQSYVDGKLSYSLPLAIDKRVQFALTLETTWSYFGSKPSQGQTNSVTPTFGLTIKFGS